MTRTTTKPRLLPALRLRCPYCGETTLRQGRSWFVFDRGCQRCDYAYEREVGYFTGASWLVNFPVVGVTSFVFAAILLALYPDWDALVIAIVASVFILILGILFTPFSMALWMYFEHSFHPLDEDDKYPLPEQDN